MTDVKFTRRDFLKGTLFASLLATSGVTLSNIYQNREKEETVFIERVSSYNSNTREIIEQGLKASGITKELISGKKILLKPNIVEAYPGTEHVVTHPSIIGAAAEAFLNLDAREVLVAEGTAHRKDILYCIEQTGILDVLIDNKLPFIDVNTSDVFKQSNAGRFTKIKSFWLPNIIREADFIVSIAKMKTHHWAGVTLSMKNLFGLMPGNVYGYPKNVLHHAGIPQSILDINSTVKPDFAIVDGIIGMEGDGPLMGTPINSGVLVMGKNCAAVDATCARIMGIDPQKISYLKASSGYLGTIRDKNIKIKGFDHHLCRKDFRLESYVPAHQSIRLS